MKGRDLSCATVSSACSGLEVVCCSRLSLGSSLWRCSWLLKLQHTWLVQVTRQDLLHCLEVASLPRKDLRVVQCLRQVTACRYGWSSFIGRFACDQSDLVIYSASKV